MLIWDYFLPLVQQLAKKRPVIEIHVPITKKQPVCTSPKQRSCKPSLVSLTSVGAHVLVSAFAGQSH